MHNSTDSRQRPTLNIYYAGEKGSHDYGMILEALIAGIEEEGIPYRVVEHSNGDAISLGNRAALDSSLGVGIGIEKNLRIAVHYNKLPFETPLFCTDENPVFEEVRILGGNAAKLVKGYPFKL